MLHSVLALSVALLAFTPMALAESTCENPVEDGVESGECLLQSQLAQQTQKYTELVTEDEEADDAHEDFEEEHEDAVEDLEQDPAEDEDSEDDGPDEPEASELQFGPGWDPKLCGNWFGNNLDWNSVKATGKAQLLGGTTGTFIPQKTCWNYGDKKCIESNVCSYTTTVGLQGVVGNQHSPGAKTVAYSCKGLLNGKQTACKSTTELGKNGGGIKTDCVNGLCADKSNVKGDWSQSKAGFTCSKYSSKTPHHRPVAPTYNLLSANGKPRFSLWDPNCKVLCESIPECTGFTVKTLQRGTPTCSFFTGVTMDTIASSKCRTHAHYATYFLKRR
eukprot:gnl/MRDRNA2_/MRDRNA2_21436_c0_seq1.p1 gnl/MRDRNA2_/MRDRNA2_21436_c0~~gnl/MRDRNA2_/MRDRNA2_21436_c0_seq1.p1  ORF type:complete len:360 (+),score=74.29 gnl/MRDRNA2_/MRDRNA2_21436_c0_seq1:85-1080(+)